jgi:hypothetical protein
MFSRTKVLNPPPVTAKKRQSKKMLRQRWYNDNDMAQRRILEKSSTTPKRKDKIPTGRTESDERRLTGPGAVGYSGAHEIMQYALFPLPPDSSSTGIVKMVLSSASAE